MAVITSAQAAEILIKARIAQEHPLLLFSNVHEIQTNEELLGLKDLIERGKTHVYEKLPNLLFSSTGIAVPDLERYRAFGKLRNSVMHFLRPSDAYNESELSDICLSFLFRCIYPLIISFWDDVDPFHYVYEYDDVAITDGYLVERLNNLSIPIPSLLVSEPVG